MPDNLSRFLNGVTALMLPAAVFMAAVTGCGGPAKVGTESAPEAPPTELFLEKTVSGTMLGLPMGRPIALAVSDRGSVYLLEGANKRVIWFGRDLVPLRDFSGRGDLATSFSDPRSIAVDADRNVWISDFGHRRLLRTNDRLELTGEVDFRNDTTFGGLGRPGGVAVTGFGDIWTVDVDNQRIIVLDAVGDPSQTVGDFGHPGGKLDHPSKLLKGQDGHIWVCDRGNRRLMVYDGEGGVVREIGTGILEDPVAMALDSRHRVWVLEFESGKIHCFDREGRYLSTVGPAISGASQPLSHPTDLVFTADGQLIIADAYDRLLICRTASPTPVTGP